MRCELNHLPLALILTTTLVGQSPVKPAQSAEASKPPLTGQALKDAQKAFTAKLKALYGIDYYSPLQVAYTSIGITRAQLVERFKVQCPKEKSEPDVAEPTYWAYYWEMATPVIATFRFDKAGRVESVKIEKSTPTYGLGANRYPKMLNFIDGNLPIFACTVGTVPQYGRLPIELKPKLVSGFVDDATLTASADHGDLYNDSALFWIAFKNPANQSYVTIAGITNAYDMCDRKRVLDTTGGTYKDTYSFHLEERWINNGVSEIYVGKAPRVTARHSIELPVPPLPKDTTLK